MKVTLIAAAAFAALAPAACGGSNAVSGSHKLASQAASTAASSPSQSSPSPSQSSPSPSQSSAYVNTGTTDSSLLACGTVVDTNPADVGFKGSSLTAEQVISYLEATILADGVRDIPLGTLSSTESTILNGAAIDLKNYYGDKLADDSEQFAQDEQSYMGIYGGGTIDTSYASAVTTDITTLMKDCPASARDALKILHQG